MTPYRTIVARHRRRFAPVMAMDLAPARAVDGDGHMHVKQSNISKSNVCGYFGREIPDYERLGLDANKLYRLYRDPVELENAAESFNGKPLLFTHRSQTAADHDHDLVVGSINNANFGTPYLKADLTVWTADAIDAIESGRQRELSCAYRYRADMRPGVAGGERYDGVMRDIVGNHCAIVPEGRAGSDVCVADARPPRLRFASRYPDADRIRIL